MIHINLNMIFYTHVEHRSTQTTHKKHQVRLPIIDCLEKLSANGQFFVGAQMAVSLYQTTQIISGVSLTTTHVAYASTNKTKIV